MTVHFSFFTFHFSLLIDVKHCLCPQKICQQILTRIVRVSSNRSRSTWGGNLSGLDLLMLKAIAVQDEHRGGERASDARNEREDFSGEFPRWFLVRCMYQTLSQVRPARANHPQTLDDVDTLCHQSLWWPEQVLGLSSHRARSQHPSVSVSHHR